MRSWIKHYFGDYVTIVSMCEVVRQKCRTDPVFRKTHEKRVNKGTPIPDAEMILMLTEILEQKLDGLILIDGFMLTVGQVEWAKNSGLLGPTSLSILLKATSRYSNHLWMKRLERIGKAKTMKEALRVQLRAQICERHLEGVVIAMREITPRYAEVSSEISNIRKASHIWQEIREQLMLHGIMTGFEHWNLAAAKAAYDKDLAAFEEDGKVLVG